MYRILVIGAGYVGGELARYFKAQKQKVWAVRRSSRNKEEWEKEGIQLITADLTCPETLVHLPAADFIVLSPAPSERNESSYRQIYLEGIGNYLTALKRNPRPLLVVYLSSTGVWKDQGGRWVDETVPADADTKRGQILAEAEKQVLNSGFPSIVFRLAGIYGPDRNRLDAIQKGSWPEAGNDGYMNLIHRDDIVAAVHLLFKKGTAGEIYLGVDDEPVLRSEYYAWLCGKLNRSMEDPFAKNKAIFGKRCSNQKLKQLGYVFKSPTFREGYQAWL